MEEKGGKHIDIHSEMGGGSERISGEQDRVIDREGGVIDLYSAHTSGLFSLADLWLVTHN